MVDEQGATAEERFSALAATFDGRPGVTYGGSARRGFGSTALKTDERIFAMLVGGRLAVKLPRARVVALVAAGAGAQLDSGNGRQLREWLCLAPDAAEDWAALAGEALAFVGGAR